MGKIILSVIIPCYNDGKYLLEAIESVKKYEGKSYEIIIINDGSTDKMTLEIFKSLKKQGHIVIHQKNKGPGSARNSGIRKAKGEYLLFLDADDMIKSEYIVTGLRVLEENPEIGVVYSDYQFFGEREEIKRALDFNFSSLIRFNYISVCALVRKQAWIDSRGFDTNLDKLAWEDWIFWLDVYKAGWKFYRIPKVMFYYRIKDNSRNKLIENPKIKKRVLDYVA